MFPFYDQNLLPEDPICQPKGFIKGRTKLCILHMNHFCITKSISFEFLLDFFVLKHR